MIINASRVDYLTLTSFTKHDEMLASFADLYRLEHANEVKINGYSGHQWEGLFFGTGRQKDRPHYILKASGDSAHDILWRTGKLMVKCTRIDLQVTIPRPVNFEPLKLYDILASIDTEWPSRRLVPTIIKSGDGFDTIYVGSRTSDRFARIYIKADYKGRPDYLRFEMEFKGLMAEAVRDAIVEDRATAKTILRAEVRRLPFAASRALRAFDKVLEGDMTKIRPEAVYGQNRTLDWLENQVEPTIFRMLHSHEHGDRMREILNRWVNGLT